jgi:dipeptidyl aminopeptidase/acylaminoacyl peptidase
VEALMQLASPSDPQIRPDGKAYAYVYRRAVHVAPLAGNGASDKQIATGTRPRWSPDSRSLAFLDKQIQLHDVSRGSTRRLTNSELLITSFSWVPDGRAIAYVAVDGGPEPDPVVADHDYRFARLYLQPLAGGAPKLITKADRHVVSFAIAPDSNRLVYAAQTTPRNRDTFNVDLYEVDLRSGTEKALVTQPGRDADPSYSPDGQLVAFHSQAGSKNYFEARHVGLIASGGGTIRYLTKGQPFDVFRSGNAFSWTSDSRTLMYTAGLGVRDVLIRQDLASGKAATVTENISGAASFTPDGASAVMLKTSTEKPLEIFLRTQGSERQLTQLQQAVSEHPRMKSEVVSWKSPDGLAVQGILWLPADYREGKRIPMLTELHGGPTGAALHAYPSPRVYPTQLFVQQGMAVFVPNFRGSSNYGAEFRLKNANSQGVGDYADVMSGIDHLVAKGIADPQRLGVMGWSYGGYLTGSVITQTQRFKAASVGAPATDWITYYGQSDGPRDTLLTYFGGTPWQVPESYMRHSSRAKLKDIRTPTLLQVGSLDINHNAEIYSALTDNKVPAEYVVYPREGHGISEPAHVRDLLERNYRWFMRWLNGGK